MSDPQIVISLEGDRHDFQPGDTLAAQYSISGFEQVEPKSLEVSVLWYTEGKGDEDLGVHYFDRVTYDDAAFARFQHPQRLTTVLPKSPLSYEGVILKIRWCIRVRLFLARNREVMVEAPFRLGRVPMAAALPAE
jgi:hypothetical protein